MKDNTYLKNELASTQDLYYNIITLRKKKMIGRWMIGAVFYYSLRSFTWIQYLFWIGLFSEVLLLAFTLRVYFRLKSKIQKLELEVEDNILIKRREG